MGQLSQRKTDLCVRDGKMLTLVFWFKHQFKGEVLPDSVAPWSHSTPWADG